MARRTCFLVAASICAILTSITIVQAQTRQDSVTRIYLPGFSVLPPNGRNWSQHSEPEKGIFLFSKPLLTYAQSAECPLYSGLDFAVYSLLAHARRAERGRSRIFSTKFAQALCALEAKRFWGCHRARARRSKMPPTQTIKQTTNE